MITALYIVLLVLAVFLVSGTLLNFSKHPHWYIRGWDFPRVFTASLAAAVGVPYAIFFHSHWWDWALFAGLAFVIVRQLYLIYPYTTFAPTRVKRADMTSVDPDSKLRLVMSNLLQENDRHDDWIAAVRSANPDVFVALEASHEWDRAIEVFQRDYPFHVRFPQDNYYGMVLYSRLPFDGEPEIRFLVQDDIPSIHLTLKLRDGSRVRLHAMHPRPPEPLRNQDSAPRDAELVILGREIGEKERGIATIVCGDLNDVAWSYTTQLFLRLSRMLDPRMGRGQYNSYNAKSRIFRFPLDHVFHSDEFKLVDLRVLPYVGSDHFPVLIELACQPEAGRQVQPESQPKAEDQEEAQEIIETQREREADEKQAKAEQESNAKAGS